MVELSPMQKTINRIQPHCRVAIPMAPASMAATSIALAIMISVFLEKRSAAQPAHAEKSTNGRAKSNVAVP